MRPSARFLLLVLAAGCRREGTDKPIPVIDARPPVVAPAKTVAPDSKPAAVYDPSDPLSVPSLEISGEVQVAPEASPPKRIFIYISSGDCLDENAPLLRRMPVTDTGAFLAHIVAQPGTELSICAAGEFVADGPSTLYGKYAKPFHVGPQREQELREVKINLAIAPSRKFPTPKK